MRYLRLSGRKRRAHSPLRLRDEARLVIGARVSSRNQQILCLRQQAVRAPMLMCPGTCRRATPATRRSTAHCTWRLIAPTAVPPDVTRPQLATAGPRDTSCETLCIRHHCTSRFSLLLHAGEEHRTQGVDALFAEGMESALSKRR